ncbi:hypothetical protein McpCs1_13130 [Methanocorpusculaceae archaeon Cs1]|uniref:Uncharacterized protein n=1 Tax=Methanorbis rubei TaxID=3028300 RepID=A0AAE4SCL8_9EURY|nr:hypothetical protein [Methanocorpusculaceae archaeon Cs1]
MHRVHGASQKKMHGERLRRRNARNIFFIFERINYLGNLSVHSRKAVSRPKACESGAAGVLRAFFSVMLSVLRAFRGYFKRDQK